MRRVLVYLPVLAAAALVFVGCKESEVAAAKAAADAAAASPNPWVMALGTLISGLFGSHIVSKSNDTKHDAKPWSDDDISAMILALESRGYVLTRKS